MTIDTCKIENAYKQALLIRKKRSEAINDLKLLINDLDDDLASKILSYLNDIDLSELHLQEKIYQTYAKGLVAGSLIANLEKKDVDHLMKNTIQDMRNDLSERKKDIENIFRDKSWTIHN